MVDLTIVIYYLVKTLFGQRPILTKFSVKMDDREWKNAPEIVQFLRYPATSIVIGMCTLIWIYIYRNGIDYAHVGSSYRHVVIEHQ